jgi:hypothetical protein
MSIALEQAVRSVLDHGRKHDGHIEIPLADYAALAVSCPANGGQSQMTVARQPGGRDLEYERELRKLYENAELDP